MILLLSLLPNLLEGISNIVTKVILASWLLLIQWLGISRLNQWTEKPTYEVVCRYYWNRRLYIANVATKQLLLISNFMLFIIYFMSIYFKNTMYNT